MSLRTYAGGMRVAVLARAERLTEQAADALLKTLEEPPPGTVIVLCAASPEALPATILSRAQHVSLATVPVRRIVAWLEAAGIEPRLARLAAALSGGRPGRALRLASEPGALAAEVEALHAFLAIAGGGLDGALRAAAELTPGAGSEGRERALLLLAVWSSFVRDAALEASGVSEFRLWADYADPLERWAESLGAGRLTDILGALLRAGGEIAQYAQPRLTFETLFLDIFAGPEPPPPVEAPAAPAAVADAPDAVAQPARRPGGAAPAEPAALKPAGSWRSAVVAAAQHQEEAEHQERADRQQPGTFLELLGEGALATRRGQRHLDRRVGHQADGAGYGLDGVRRLRLVPCGNHGVVAGRRGGRHGRVIPARNKGHPILDA